MARQVKTVSQSQGTATDGTPQIIDVPFTALTDELGNPVDLDDSLQQILQIQKKQLAVLRALLAHFNGPDTVSQLEEDFLNID